MVPLSEEAKLKKQKKNNGNIPPPNKVSGEWCGKLVILFKSDYYFPGNANNCSTLTIKTLEYYVKYIQNYH